MLCGLTRFRVEEAVTDHWCFHVAVTDKAEMVKDSFVQSFVNVEN